MCIRCTTPPTRGSGLMEYTVVIGIVSILLLVMSSLFVSSTTHIARAFNYSDMSASSQTAMDSLSRDIRSANRVVALTNSSSIYELELEDASATRIKYTYRKVPKTLTRTRGTQNKVLLRQCESITFNLFKRNPSGGFIAATNATPAECKAVSVSWKCSRSGQARATENATSGQIVIRRQRT